MIKVDFHVHTTASDGLLTPSETVKRAVKNNVKYLAITDHDTVSGIDEALKAAETEDIKVIPGIELSTQHNGENIHILGYFKDNSYKNESLNKKLKEIRDHRKVRAQKMIQLLKDKCNININYEDVLKNTKDSVGRPHIAKAIINAGYNYTFDDIFNKFIGKDCPAYVPTLKVTTEEGIALLKSNNAAVVELAHPKLIKNSPLEEFLNMDFDGIEAYYFLNTPDETEFYVKTADERGLIYSCGSDCHGNIESDTKHGDIGCVEFNQKALERLLEKL